jgi:hypothetical protein
LSLEPWLAQSPAPVNVPLYDSGGRKDIATRTDKLPVEVHEVLTGCLADFLEPRLMDSHTTVIIPFDNRVIFVRSLDGTQFPSRYSEVAQTFNPITANQLLACGRRRCERRPLGAV